MSKYFKNNINSSIQNITEEYTHNTAPAGMTSINNINDETFNKNKNILSESTIPQSNTIENKHTTSIEMEYITKVIEDNNDIKELIDNYTSQTKEHIKNQFEKFSPAELFEKMNQMTFLMMSLTNKITNLEKTLDQFINNSSSSTKQLHNIEKQFTTEELYNMQENRNKMNTNLNIPTNSQENPNNTSTQINKDLMDNLMKMKNGDFKNLNAGNYIDNGVSLEEMFPDMQNEAYQAGYNAISMVKTDKTTTTSPIPGNMRGINGF